VTGTHAEWATVKGAGDRGAVPGDSEYRRFSRAQVEPYSHTETKRTIHQGLDVSEVTGQQGDLMRTGTSRWGGERVSGVAVSWSYRESSASTSEVAEK